jgi:flagellar biosynthetic protein FliO
MNIGTGLTETTTFTQPDLYTTAIKTFSTLAVMLAVILIGFYLMKRFWPKGAGFMGAHQWVKVITATSIAPKKMISLVEVGDEILVLGLTESHISLLTKVTDEQMIYSLRASLGKKSAGSPFYQQFKGLINKYDYKEEKEQTMLRTHSDDPHGNSEVLDKTTLSRANT